MPGEQPSPGAGKSTLLNIIGGIDQPSSGEVWVDGDNLAAMTDRQITEYRRRKIGFVFQFYNLVPTLTGVENVQVSTQIAAHFMDPAEALKLVDLSEQMHHFPAQMSRGQQQGNWGHPLKGRCQEEILLHCKKKAFFSLPR